MKTKHRKMTRKKHLAIAALLDQPTIKKAAEVAGIGEVTLHRWLQTDEFREEYRKARHEVVRQAIARLQRVSGEAVQILWEIMRDDSKPANARVTSARTILDTALKALEVEDLAARIERLEFLLKDSQ